MKAGGPLSFSASMPSVLDQFLTSASAVADPTIGEDELVLDGGLKLLGVWSAVNTGEQSADGGFAMEADATISVRDASTVTRDLIGKTGSAKGERFRIVSIDAGEVFTTVFLRHASTFAS